MFVSIFYCWVCNDDFDGKVVNDFLIFLNSFDILMNVLSNFS